MKFPICFWKALVVICLLTISCTDKTTPKVLVFSKTEGFRHESISSGIDLIKELGVKNGYDVETTEDAKFFKQSNLKNFSAVVFLNTTGDIFDRSQEHEFRRYIQAGGGFVGIHAAADTEYDWPWYGELVGAYFSGHPNNPNVRQANVIKTDHNHKSTDHLPDTWPREDEWYNYKSINPGITSLLNLDESSYEGGTNGAEHPIAWYHDFDGGRSFYTGGGHTHESFKEDLFVNHLSEGIIWAMGEKNAVDYSMATVSPEENRFKKEVLDDTFNEPMELEILPDGRIVFIERRGGIKLYDEKKGSSEKIAEIEVYSGEEDGLMGIALDPNYAKNKWAYICYSDPKESHQNVSRFVFDPDAKQVLSDEKVLFTVATQRDECCHSAGSLEFDHLGNLWASFGDNTNPHQSNGHAPIDERSGRAPFDAQKSSANTQDLRGKILRIKPNDDGTYSIPDGNLFPKDGSQGRAEIYVMGCRNPFRFTIDSKNGNLYWGEVGPDANEDNSNRGPRGYDEVNQAKAPGFFGWPYFIGNNIPYNDFDFQRESAGDQFDPRKPFNNSPNNKGIRDLPPAQAAMVYYPYAKSSAFPYLGSGGRNAMAGFVYYEDEFKSNPNRWPKYYDQKLFMYDWMRGWIMAVSFDESGNYKSMEPFLPSLKWDNLMDVKMSKEGVLYTLEYGKGWFRENEDARLSRITFNPGNRSPSVDFKASITSGATPLKVEFDANGSQDEDGDELQYIWDFGDGKNGTGVLASHSYNAPGEYAAKLTVKDKKGLSASDQLRIIAGNTPPELSIELSGNQSFYFPGKTLEYQVLAQDKEDGKAIDDKIAVSINYLERGYDLTNIAQGHEALAKMLSGHEGLKLLEASDCQSCHKKDGTSVGPSYINIATKYANRKDAKDYLSSKIISGGGGVWGEVAMAAHPDMKPAEAQTIADYIMSLSSPGSEKAIPAKGTYSFKVPPGKEEGGKYVIIASYSDKGAENVPSLRSSKELVLRSSNMSATDFTEIDKSTKFTITPEMNPILKKDMDVVMLADQGTVMYDGIDLNSVSSLVIVCSAPKPYFGGGDLELYLDDLTGTPIGKITIVPTGSPGEVISSIIPLKNVTGKHKLIFRSISAQSSSGIGILTNVIFNPS